MKEIALTLTVAPSLSPIKRINMGGVVNLLLFQELIKMNWDNRGMTQLLSVMFPENPSERLDYRRATACLDTPHNAPIHLTTNP